MFRTPTRVASRRGAGPRAPGTFTFEGLPPGEYTLTAFAPPERGQKFGFGQTRVSVTAGDLDGIVIRARRGAEVSGRVVFDGVPKPPMGTMRITAVPLEGRWPGSGVSVDVTPQDGAFTLTPLFGDCLLGVEGIPPGWMLEGLYVNGKNVLGLPVAFRGGETITGARVVVTQRAASVKVTVQTEEVMYGPRDFRGARLHSNAYVVVYRDGPRRGSAHASPFHRTALPREGTSTFDALPPGDYFAVAMSTQAAFGEFDADAVERLRALGTRFSIREGENKGITVGAIPWWGWSSDSDVDHVHRSGSPARRGTGSLRGRVVDATSGAPLRDADVTISQDKADTMRSAATDADGRYEFQGLPDGSYRVTAAKSGFDGLTYGERPPVRDETLVEVGGGRGVPVIDLRLQRQCALAGRVVDELGEPVSRAEVAIQRRDERDDGTPYPIEEGNTWTNDLGQFRIPGLSAGQYFLVAGLPTLVPDDVEDGERAKRVATYYPGTTEPAAAQPIRLAPGQTAEVTIELARPDPRHADLGTRRRCRGAAAGAGCRRRTHRRGAVVARTVPTRPAAQRRHVHGRGRAARRLRAGGGPVRSR